MSVLTDVESGDVPGTEQPPVWSYDDRAVITQRNLTLFNQGVQAAAPFIQQGDVGAAREALNRAIPDTSGTPDPQTKSISQQLQDKWAQDTPPASNGGFVGLGDQPAPAPAAGGLSPDGQSFEGRAIRTVTPDEAIAPPQTMSPISSDDFKANAAAAVARVHGGGGGFLSDLKDGVANVLGDVHSAYTAANNAVTANPDDPNDTRNGDFFQNIQSSPLTGTGAMNAIPNPSLLPLRSTAEFLTSPAGVASIIAPTALGAAGAADLPGLAGKIAGGIAGESALESPAAAAKFGASTVGAFGAQNAANDNLPTDYPGAAIVNNVVAPLVGGLLTHKIAGAAIDAAPGIADALGSSLTGEGALAGERGSIKLPGGTPDEPLPFEDQTPAALNAAAMPGGASDTALPATPPGGVPAKVAVPADRITTAADGSERIVPERLSTGIESALQDKGVMMTKGPVTMLADRMPLFRRIAGLVSPDKAMPDNVVTAYRAEAGVRSMLTTRFTTAMREPVAALKAALVADPPEYIGEQGTVAQNALIGSAKDILDRPNEYTISPDVRKAMDAYDRTQWDQVTAPSRKFYNVDVQPYSGEPGSVYTPNIESAKAASNEVRIDQAAKSVSSTAMSKERAYTSAWDRVGEDPKYSPETSLSELTDAHNQGMVSNAANETFKQGAGGLTKTEMMEQVHPGLVAQRARVANLVDSLDARLQTATDRLTEHSAKVVKANSDLAKQTERLDAFTSAASARTATVTARAHAARAALSEARGMLTDARQQALGNARDVGGAQTLDKQATSAVSKLLAKGDVIGQKLDALDKQLSATLDAKEVTPEWRVSDVKDLGKQAKDINAQIGAITRKAAALPFDPVLGHADDTYLQRATSEIRAKNANTDLRVAERNAVSAGEKAGLTAQDNVLAHMEGRINEIEGRIRQMGKIADASSEKAGDFANLQTGLQNALDDVKVQKKQLATAYRQSGTGDFVFDKNTSRYYSPDAAKAVAELKRTPTGFLKGTIGVLDEIRAWHFAGDGSPFTIQGQLGTLSDPLSAARTARAALGENPVEALVRIAKEQPADVEAYSFSMNKPFGEQVPELRQPKGLGRIPVVGGKLDALETNMFAFVERQSFDMWKSQRDQLVKNGMDVNEANHAAAAVTQQVIPSMDPTRRAISPLRAGVERATMTSVSFATSPALMLKDAASGLVKLGTAGTIDPAEAWAHLSGREQLAIKRSLTLAATVGTISATSAAASAASRNMSVKDAVKETFDVNSRYFAALQLGDGRSIPIGGPTRSFIKALAPGGFGADKGIPFVGLWDYSMNKLNSAPRITKDLLQNSDYNGNKILSGNFGQKVLQALWYAGEQVAPMSVGQLGTDLRQNGFDPSQMSPSQTLSGVASQFAGTNYSPPSPTEQLNQISRSQGLGDFFADSPSQKLAIQQQNPDLWKQYLAGASNATAANETAKSAFIANETGRDNTFMGGKMTVQDWYNTQLNDRNNLAGQEAQIYANSSHGAPKTASDRYYAEINANTTNNLPDWTKIRDWLTQQSPEDQQYIDQNTGLLQTPLTQLRKDLSKQLYAIPKYVGYTGDQASAIDALVQDAKNHVVATLRGDTASELRGLSSAQSANPGKYDAATVAGARRAILGLLVDTGQRTRWTTAHPESALLYGKGIPGPATLAAINAALAKQKP